MKNTFTIKQVIIFILIITIIGAVILSIKPKKKENVVVLDEQKSSERCYYRSTKTDRGFYDVAWLKLNVLDDKVTGEFHNLPAEKDSKVGAFTGTMLPVDSTINEKSVTVWWDSRAEGMEVKEELTIKFGSDNATVGFGEMVDSQLGDGVYLYKDKKNLYYIKPMNQIDCDTLDEKLFTEKYIRDNIKTIATDKPVLGGSWYVISVIVNSITNTGDVVYEDGHIQSKASLTYTYEENPQNITVTKFEIK